MFRSQEISHIPQMHVQNNLYGMKIEIWVQSEKQKVFTKRGFKIWYGSKPKPIRVLNSLKIPATRNHRETQSGFSSTKHSIRLWFDQFTSPNRSQSENDILFHDHMKLPKQNPRQIAPITETDRYRPIHTQSHTCNTITI